MDNSIDLTTIPSRSDLINDFQSSYSHEFDAFQLHAFNTIEQNSNILVSVPTSCGKTIVAEFGVYWAMNQNKKSIYTSPIKTLSNQKFHEFKQRFGSDNVGIITGDIKFNPDAKCIIMTTEILRYLLVKHDSIIDETALIVFDEVHYINNDDRGHIWEECIVLLPNEISMVMLSATISKPELFVSWLNSIKMKKTFMVNHNNRPVPLTHYIVNNNSNELITVYKNGVLNSNNYQMMYSKFKPIDERLGIHKIEELIKTNKLYPVLLFVFSRHKCEQYANMITSSFNDEDVQAKIEMEVNLLLKQYQYDYEMLINLPQIKHIIKLALKGVGYHHSGLLPICKEIIEILFSKNYIKVLFVTETFSVGVNMPTKSVIFVDLTKCVNGQHRYLYTDEYFQMSGRAGRRGKDTTGSVIYYPIKKMLSHPDFKSIIDGELMTLHSRYQIDCISVLNDINQSSDMVSKTYMYLELIKINTANKSKLSEVSENVNKLSEEISNMHVPYHVVQLINQWRKLSTTENNANSLLLNSNINIRINPKKEKQIKNDKIKFKKELISNGVMDTNGKYVAIYQEYMQKIDKFDEMSKNYDKLDDMITTFDSSIMDKYQLSLDQLIKAEYISDSRSLKTNGIFASNITNVNGILLTELVDSDWFTKLEPIYIGTLLSTLIIDNSHSNMDDKNISDLDINTKLPTFKKYYDLMMNTISDINKKFELSTEITNSIELVDPTYYWINGEIFQNLLAMLSGIEGNFVRSMLRLARLCEEINKAVEITNKHIELLPKLEYIIKSINRDIVVFDSIYIK